MSERFIRIAISYRSDDADDAASRLREFLGDRPTLGRLILVVDLVDLIEEFVGDREVAIYRSDVLLALIGPQWLAMTDDRRRIDSRSDHVRTDIRWALKNDVPVIPILVDGALMPQARDLPLLLRPLAREQAIDLGLEDAGTEDLLLALKEYSHAEPVRPASLPLPGPGAIDAEAAAQRDLPPTGRSDVADDQPLYVDENVQFTVYRPRTIQPDRWSTMLAFAHLAERRPDADPDELDPIDEVRRQAEQVLGVDFDAFADLTQDSVLGVPREGEITFVPDAPGVEFNPVSRTFLWLEPVHREEFRLRASHGQIGEMIRGRLSVFLGVRLLAEIQLQLRVADSSADARPNVDQVKDEARPYRRIFASYSHRDVKVAEQFEHYAAIFGDRYLRDWIDLRAGEIWSDRLEELIREADVFQLFWSSNSMRSPNVRREWEYALSLDRPYFVRPTYWETPMPRDGALGLPPPALESLHFHRLALDAVRPAAQLEVQGDASEEPTPPTEAPAARRPQRPQPRPAMEAVPDEANPQPPQTSPARPTPAASVTAIPPAERAPSDELLLPRSEANFEDYTTQRSMSALDTGGITAVRATTGVARAFVIAGLLATYAAIGMLGLAIVSTIVTILQNVASSREAVSGVGGIILPWIPLSVILFVAGSVVLNFAYAFGRSRR